MRKCKPAVSLHVRINPHDYDVLKEQGGERGLSTLINQILAAWVGDGRIRVAVDDYEAKQIAWRADYERQMAKSKT